MALGRLLVVGAVGALLGASCLPDPHSYVGYACDDSVAHQCPDSLFCCTGTGTRSCGTAPEPCPTDGGSDGGGTDGGSGDSGSNRDSGTDSGLQDSGGGSDAGDSGNTDSGNQDSGNRDGGLNLLFNGGFEDTSPLGAGWSGGSGTQFQVQTFAVHSGARAAEISGAPAQLNTDPASIAATAGGLHCAEAYVESGGLSSPVSLQLTRELGDASVPGPIGTWDGGAVDGGSVWGLVKTSIIRAATDSSLTLSIFATTTGDGGGGLYVDDVSVWRPVDGGC